MARPRKPVDTHTLHGTRPHYDVAAEPLAQGRPRYPRNITPEARRVFKELVK
jgi:hypothetical protein